MKNATLNFYIPYAGYCTVSMSVETGPYALRVDAPLDQHVDVYANTGSTPVVQSFVTSLSDGDIMTIHVADTSDATPVIYRADYTFAGESITASNVQNIDTTINPVTF